MLGVGPHLCTLVSSVLSCCFGYISILKSCMPVMCMYMAGVSTVYATQGVPVQTGDSTNRCSCHANHGRNSFCLVADSGLRKCTVI